ncbi:conserved hypothetical protein [Talaromyces stipitatus ATCC 10500]|uniref:WD repeat protein n=1 Tax=Talaromyces stipitatus (strain ATCC 10500 / CBS 375.48 / QM 6759 / NRRL 1006) TaxID=441959 RepID=B8MTJ0_TALSN|nr:uncharacterized protein TSTA_004440 [Talaromyces stipitatus ATCC 10500]EED12396.1 conserved hypothetical protein [Talaromyces stipitatus ATCC 10500]
MTEVIQPKTVSSLVTEFLDQPPSCLEFCPKDPNYFVVGTYLLQEHKEPAEEKKSGEGEEEGDEGTAPSSVKQTKTGSLQLWHLDITAPKLQHKQTVPLSHAVFDLKFHPFRHHILGIAGSNGSISIYSVLSEDGNNYNIGIQHIWTTSAEHANNSTLYFTWFPQDWFPLQTSPYTDGFAASFANGTTRIYLLDAERENRHDIAQNKGNYNFIVKEHLPERRKNIEPWFIALAKYRNPSVMGGSESFMFTGDDMGNLWTQSFTYPEDRNSSGDLEEDFMICDYRDTDDEGLRHTAGVTAILPLPTVGMVKKMPILLTGSYDEYIRVYHATFRGAILAQKRLGGGVWRLQLIGDPTTTHTTTGASTITEVQFLVLASCMHAGTRIVKVNWKRPQVGANELGSWDIEILAQFTENESMNYASGIWKGGETSATTGRELVGVSSSFYDKRLCLWKIQI